MRVVPYHPGLRAVWDAFVATATAGTFLFERGYTDYHAHRLTDCSLLFYDDKNRLIALLPANRVGTILYSHQGLTYGGFVTHGAYTFRLVACFNSLVQWCQSEGITHVTYKPIPFIYTTYPDQADLYCLFRLKATLTARHLSTSIEQVVARKFTDGRWGGVKKAHRQGMTVRETTDFASFWRVLDQHLHQRYGATTVHTLPEILALHTAFPAAIRLYATYDAAGELVAGAIVYVTRRVAHLQYLSATAAGRAAGALDLLIAHLVRSVYAAHPYFDFGTSNGQPGQQLNHRLLFQKEGFGGRGVCYDTYSFETTGQIE